jgi:Uma2 family endonuclease
MAATLVPPESSTEGLPRKRFTRDDLDQMLEAGLFAGQRYELIDGDLISKMAQNPPHAFSVGLGLDWLAAIFTTSRVRVQLSMEAGGSDREFSVPEPDLAVLLERKPEYQHRHPRGDEILLAVEVADTSLKLDLTRKAALYARAGVREYWVLDLVRRLLHVHRQPEGALYRDVHIYSENETVSMEGRSETVSVTDLLPGAPPASEPGNPRSPVS